VAFKQIDEPVLQTQMDLSLRPVCKLNRLMVCLLLSFFSVKVKLPDIIFVDLNEITYPPVCVNLYICSIPGLNLIVFMLFLMLQV